MIQTNLDFISLLKLGLLDSCSDLSLQDPLLFQSFKYSCLIIILFSKYFMI